MQAFFTYLVRFDAFQEWISSAVEKSCIATMGHITQQAHPMHGHCSPSKSVLPVSPYPCFVTLGIEQISSDNLAQELS